MVLGENACGAIFDRIACDGCGRTAHITWDGTGAAKQVVNMSETLERKAGDPRTFTCRECGTVQKA